MFLFAEGAGFEPAKGLLPRVFETRAIGHYANPPVCTRQESNLYPNFRKVIFYPLNYECKNLM